jgi:hypothetical protein
VRRGTADRVYGRVADQNIVIGALSSLRVIPGPPERRTGLPPAVLRTDDARVEMGLQPCPRPYAPLWRGDYHPVPKLNTARRGRRWMEFDLRVGDEAPQAGHAAMLAMAKLRQLRTCQDEWVMLRQAGLRRRPHGRLEVVREWGIVMVQQPLRVDFDFPSRRGKAAGAPVGLVRIFAISWSSTTPAGPQVLVARPPG